MTRPAALFALAVAMVSALAAALDRALKILAGTDPSTFPRYADLLEKNPLDETRERDWIHAHAGAKSF